MPSQSEIWKSIFCPCRTSTMRGGNAAGPGRTLPPLGCHTSVLCLQYLYPLDVAYVVSMPLGLYHLKLNYRGLRRMWTIRGVLPPAKLLLSETKPPRGTARYRYSKPGLFNPWRFTTQALYQGACSVRVRPPEIVVPGALSQATCPLPWPPGVVTSMLPSSSLQH